MKQGEEVGKQLPQKVLSKDLVQKMRAEAEQIFVIISTTPIIVNNMDSLKNQHEKDQAQKTALQNQQLISLWFKHLAEDGFGGAENDPCFDNICFKHFRFVLKIATNPTYQHHQLILNFIKLYPIFILRDTRFKQFYGKKEQTKEMTTERQFLVPSLRELIRNKIGLFVNKIWELPADVFEFLSANFSEILVDIVKLTNSPAVFIPEAKLRQFHSLYCITDREQEFFVLLVNVYKDGIYIQDKYSREQLYIREQYLTEHSVFYNRKRHIEIDRYLHKYFGISGFVTDMFMQLLIQPHSPIDNFEMLIKLFCIQHLYEKNKKEAKIHLINNIFRETNRYYPEGIFKEENDKLYLFDRQQWIHVDELITQQLLYFVNNPVPIEGFPDTEEGYRVKALEWALERLAFPENLRKYLFDEPPGLNDDHFLAGLESEDEVKPDSIKSISLTH